MNVVLITDEQAEIRNGNLMDFSMIREIDCRLPFRNFSIKYVAKGTEMYRINNTGYVLNQGDYLLANQHAEGSVRIDSREEVFGICINLSLALLAEVAGDLQRPGVPADELPIETFFSSEAFLENQYAAADTALGSLLTGLGQSFHHHAERPKQFSKAFYYSLAERLIEDHRPIVAALRRVPSVKHATRKDLFKRLQSGKAFMDAHFAEIPDIASVARFSGLSEYHFFRLFRATYAESPYQYLLKKRLAHALELIQKGAMSLTDIALETGFSDIHAFSKCYKKHLGRAPSADR
ncbi:MAG: helix-turn-helix transcriptional regulator [Saprospiraceae bacterium]|nr:helix-turn-helix transcriptional regulator [Saprospiraceae bacterium]